VHLSGTPALGALLIVQVVNDGVLPRVVTFGNGFLAVGTVTGVLSKQSTVLFVGSGAVFVELARTVGL
jgi:hypothetical protein